MTTTIDDLRAKLGIKKGLSTNEHSVYMRQWNRDHPGQMAAYQRQWRADNPERYRLNLLHNRNNTVYTGGKRIAAPHKRPMPKECELCGRSLKMGYHHWDEENVGKGLWLCYPCHMFAESVDKDLVGRYLELKAREEDEFMMRSIGV